MLCVFFFPKGCVEDRILSVFLIGLWDIASTWNSQTSEADIHPFAWMVKHSRRIRFPTDRKVTWEFLDECMEKKSNESRLVLYKYETQLHLCACVIVWGVGACA